MNMMNSNITPDRTVTMNHAIAIEVWAKSSTENNNGAGDDSACSKCRVVAIFFII